MCSVAAFVGLDFSFGAGPIGGQYIGWEGRRFDLPASSPLFSTLFSVFALRFDGFLTACTGGLGGCLSLVVGIDDVADLFGNSPVTDRASNKSTRVFFSGGTNILFPIFK